jgi:hypothetical protein
MQLPSTYNDTVSGKVIYLLVLVTINQFIYPITQYGQIYLIIYQLLYVSMFVAGIYVASDTRWHLLVTSATAFLYLYFGIWYSLDPTTLWKITAAYLALIPYLATVLLVLLRYISLARVVTHDVIYAAVAIYLLMGAFFVPVFGLLDITSPGSFVDGTHSTAPIQWQQFIYYSYATLTTVGYGDILPVSWWARSFSSAETVIGVLYLAILMARLVGMYAQEK